MREGKNRPADGGVSGNSGAEAILRYMWRSADGGANGAGGGGATTGNVTPTDSKPPAEDASKQQNPTQGDTEIKDPVAFAKAKAEENDRLHKLLAKTKQEAEEARARADKLESEAVTELKKKYDELLQLVEQEKSKAQQATTEALRVRIAGEFKLGSEAVAFLTGSDEATLRQQAESLAKLTGAKGTPPPTNNVGNPAGNGGLTWDAVKNMTPQEVARNWSEIAKMKR